LTVHVIRQRSLFSVWHLVSAYLLVFLSVSCGFYNDPPVADAGLDSEILLGENAVLDGSRSRDAEGDTLQYSWTLYKAPGGSGISSQSITNADKAAAQVVPDAVGVFVFQLSVDDGMYTDSDLVGITVYSQDEVPDSPGGLAAGNANRNSLTLSWEDADGADTYLLYRADAVSGPFTASIYQGTNTIYIDEGLTLNTRYYYKVSARNRAGESELSAAVEGRTLP